MIALIYRRPWLTVFGINAIALFLVGVILAVWERDASLLTKGAVIAPIGALAFTLKQTWWWDDKNPPDAIWLKRFIQTGAIWGVVLVVLGFVLLGSR